MIINILQNELLLSKASLTTCAENQSPTEGPCSKPNTEVWTLAAYNNNIVKSQKRAKSIRGEFSSSGHYVSTANRFSPLSNLERVFAEHSGTQKSNECTSTQRVHKTTNQSKGNKIPTLVNGILDSHSEFSSTTYNEETANVKCHQAKMRKTQIVKSLNKVKHKVLITGDSHARNCANLLQDNLRIDYKVSSFVKPGAQMNEIKNTASEELKPLKGDDLAVVWGGTNDISRNNTKEALKSVSEFVNENKELNVVLINSPHRHDLLPESCVNQEVTKFNRQVQKIMKLQSKVKILELNLDRNHFTTHGLHLNSKGKELVSQELALVIQQFFKKKQTPTISIPWKDSSLAGTDTEIQDLNTNNETNKSAKSSHH
jgi:lysophospholipase L1-like esterase